MHNHTSDERFDPENFTSRWETYAPASFERSELLSERHLLAREGRYAAYFGPIGAWPEPSARVLFVGLTPGFQQLESAARLFMSVPATVRNDRRKFARLLLQHVAFHGSMRRNLCKMLDRIALPRAVGVSASEELFAEGSSAVAATSALVYPIVVGPNQKNYSGSRLLTRVALFRQMIEALLRPRLECASNALVVPFGVAAECAVMHLVENGALSGAEFWVDFLIPPAPTVTHPECSRKTKGGSEERSQNGSV